MTRRSWVTLLIWCMVLGLTAWFVATRTQVETELSRLLPEGATPTERLLLTELRTGAGGRLILIALEGEEADLLAGASKQLAAWMHESGRFSMSAMESTPGQRRNGNASFRIDTCSAQACRNPDSVKIISATPLSCG